MCSSDLISFNGRPSTFLPKMFLKKAKVLRLINARVRPSTGRRIRLKKRRQIWEEEEMKMVNMRLFFENRRIMEENKRLRERALFLSQENQVLAHLQTIKKSSNFSAPLL